MVTVQGERTEENAFARAVDRAIEHQLGNESPTPDRQWSLKLPRLFAPDGDLQKDSTRRLRARFGHQGQERVPAAGNVGPFCKEMLVLINKSGRYVGLTGLTVEVVRYYLVLALCTGLVVGGPQDLDVEMVPPRGSG